MRKNTPPALVLLACLLGGHSLSAQNGTASEPHTRIYLIKPAVDLPVFFAAAAWDAYNFSQISKKEGSDPQRVASLKISDIDGLDRWAVHPYSKSIDQLSYIPFYVAIPLPLIVF